MIFTASLYLFSKKCSYSLFIYLLIFFWNYIHCWNNHWMFCDCMPHSSRIRTVIFIYIRFLLRILWPFLVCNCLCFIGTFCFNHFCSTVELLTGLEISFQVNKFFQKTEYECRITFIDSIYMWTQHYDKISFPLQQISPM